MSVEIFYFIAELLLAMFVFPPIVVELMGYLYDRTADRCLCILAAFPLLVLVAVGASALIAMVANLLKSILLIY